jgi:hypothetical protein
MGICGQDADQAPVIWEREWPKECGIDNAKYSTVRTNSENEREDDCRGICPLLSE